MLIATLQKHAPYVAKQKAKHSVTALQAMYPTTMQHAQQIAQKQQLAITVQQQTHVILQILHLVTTL